MSLICKCNPSKTLKPMKRTMFVIVVMVGLLVICSCEPVTMEESNPTRQRVDTVSYDSLPPGYVQIGDVIINTNWDGEKFQNF